MKPALKHIDFSTIFFYLMGLSNLVLIVLLILLFSKFLPDFWKSNLIYLFFVVIAVNTIYLTSEIKKIPEEKRNKRSIVYLAKYFFILLLSVIAANQFLKREIIIQLMPYITTITIACGFLTFYAHKNKVEKELEDEKTAEENAEKKRLTEFDKKFPRIAKLNLAYGFGNAKQEENWVKRLLYYLLCTILVPVIWIIRLPYNLIKWMYKEGWIYPAGLILIVMIYLFIQFSMFQYPGNYPDENRHILTGKSLLETGEFPILSTDYGDRGYLRGMPISYLVALFFSIFGISLFTAKLVPITIGFINLFLLNGVSKEIISDKKIRFILLFIFVFSSWLIFNHFYIRHYVFLEFSLIFLTFLMIKVSNNIHDKSWKNRFYLFLIILINFINYFFMYDTTRYLIPFTTCFWGVYLFLFKFQKRKTNKKDLFNLNLLKKIALILIFLIMILIIFSSFSEFNSLINTLLSGKTNTGTNHFNFNNFFLGIYIFFTIFFILGFLSEISLKNKNRIIYFLIIPLLLLHYISSDSIQIMRVMVYLLPIFYLLTCYGLEQVINIFKKNKLIVIIIIVLFIITTISILQEDRNRFFSNGYPIFPGEIGYHEYGPMYNYIKNSLSNYTIITADYNNQDEIFFNVTINYKLDFKKVVDNHYTYYYDNNSDSYKEFYTNTPVIKERKEFEEIASNRPVCVILKPYSNHFLEESDINQIKNSFRKEVSFIGFDIYCND